MTLPFLKDKEGGVSMDSSPIERKPDGEESFEMLDAIVEDLMDSITKKDKKLLKATLEALCDYIMDIDTIQDEKQLKE